MTPRHPALHTDAPPGDVRGVALVLHGGRATSRGPVRASQLAVLRMRPFVTGLQRTGSGAGLAVASLRYRMRGWNGTEASPVPDVRWALDELAQRFPDVDVALVGHSMGGRAAVYAADHPRVRTVVGLAPWIEPNDPYAPLSGRQLLVAHGDHDHMTSAANSAVFTREAGTVAKSASYVTVAGERHAMLRRASLWHELATGFVLATVCGVPPGETVGAGSAKILERALAGEPSLTA